MRSTKVPFNLSGHVAETEERYSVTELKGRLGDTDTVNNGRAFAPYGKPVELSRRVTKSSYQKSEQ